LYNIYINIFLHMLAFLIISFHCSRYRPDDGMFKLKHVAYFTLYYELCMTDMKKKYIPASPVVPVWTYGIELWALVCSSPLCSGI
jgi:hypothetical protein